MSFSLLSVAIFGITAATIYRQTRKGYKHGASRSLISSATLIFCAVFSSVISVLLAKIFGTPISELLRTLGLFDILPSDLSMLSEALVLLVMMLIPLILYLPIFYLLKALVSWIIRIVCAAMTKKTVSRGSAEFFSEDTPFYVRKDKHIGAVIGAISGLITAIVVFMPLSGLLKTGNEILGIVKQNTSETGYSLPSELDLIEHYSNDTAINVIHSCGGGTLYDLTTRASVHGYSTNLNKEIKVLKEIDVTKITQEFQATGTDGILETARSYSRKSLALKLLMTEVIKGASTSWLEGNAYLDVPRPSLGNYKAIDDFFDSVLYVCTSTSVKTIDDDLETVISLVELIGEYQSLFFQNDYTTFMKEFVEGNALQRIEDILSRNPHMQQLGLQLDSVVMNVVAEELASSKYADGSADRIYKSIASVLSDARGLRDSVKITAIANSLTESFEENGIYMPVQIQNRIATILSKNLQSGETVNIEDVEALFTQFTEDYVNEE